MSISGNVRQFNVQFCSLTKNLSVPSVVFAEASWYGSLRSGLEFTDGNTKVVDTGSRWGIKGSAEAGEGLTAVYQFEHKIDTARAGLDNPKGDSFGRLSSVGLSGGFGSVTVGQIWSASYNSVGAITDNSYWTGSSHTSLRHGNVISYAFSNDLMALQVDAVYDGARAETGSTTNDPDLEKAEFGLSVNVGEIGKVAIAHTDDKYVLDKTTSPAADSDMTLDEGDTTWRIKTNTIAGEVSVAGFRFYAGSQKEKKMCTGAVDSSDAIVACTPATAGQADSEQKRTFFGSSGSLGDTGISYLFQWRDIKDSHKPWMLGVYKSLGGGASLNLEHANNDDKTEDASYVFLVVNF